MTTETDPLPSSVAAFTEALKGGRGSLDAWLEANDESEVAAHVEAYASACASSATAAKDAEIDALRTRLEDTVRDSTNKIEAMREEVGETKEVAVRAMRQRDAQYNRAERLAEALREAYGQVRELCTCYCHAYPEESFARYEALLRDQEVGNG